MATIEVTEAGARRFTVSVTEGAGATTHDVTVPHGYPEQLGVAAVPLATLVEASFRFLLDHEPKESIMARFELPVIAGYFPSYPDEIARYLEN